MLLVCSGCAPQPIAQDLSQIQAIRIVALLNNNGIASTLTKEAGGRGKYVVRVKESRYLEAITLLQKFDLPAVEAPGLEEMTAQRGLLPNSRQLEDVRIDHALAVELQQLLENLPAVQSARVVVRLHSGEAGKPQVAVVVRTSGERDLPDAEVVQLTQQSIPGLQPAQIHVAVHQGIGLGFGGTSLGTQREGGSVVSVPLVPFLFWQVPQGVDSELSLAVTILFTLVLMAGAAIGYLAAYQRNRRGRANDSLSLDVGSDEGQGN